jgi:hypothetical protein
MQLPAGEAENSISIQQQEHHPDGGHIRWMPASSTAWKLPP